MRTATLTGRPALALVPAPTPEAQPVSFCSHCGNPPEPQHKISPTRVCPGCGLGLMLQSAEDVAPAPRGAFLVLDHTLSVCAVSAAAERLLAVQETDAVNTPIIRLLVPAEAEGDGRANLAAAITWAARGDGGVTHAVVRPANTFGVRLNVRIAPCGPPRAALLVFE